MHFTGTVWRPPYEAGSLLLEATAGCTHHRCKFCTLYNDLPFGFRMSPLADIEADLLEARAQLELWKDCPVRRVFLVGANPFILPTARLKQIAGLVRQYLPACKTIGCFARVTDLARKTDDELRELRRCGYDGLTIGAETGDDAALAFMDKGYDAQAIVTQAERLDAAQIGYHFFYLAGISGAGRGREGAAVSAAIFNRTHPKRIGSSMLTVYPDSRLYHEIQTGQWQEESELEKLEEVIVLIEQLKIPVWFGMLGASNAVRVQGTLPRDRKRMLAELMPHCRPENEAALRHYRTHLRHL